MKLLSQQFMSDCLLQLGKVIYLDPITMESRAALPVVGTGNEKGPPLDSIPHCKWIDKDRIPWAVV